MYCSRIAFCSRYFGDDRDAIETTFLVLEADEREFADAFAKYNIWSQDFQLFVEAVRANTLSEYFLLVSVDGVYAALSKRWDHGGRGDHLQLFGAVTRDEKFESYELFSLLSEFQKKLFLQPELFSEFCLPMPAVKLKTRIRIENLRNVSLTSILQLCHDAQMNPAQASDDILALTLFQSGLSNWLFGQERVSSQPLLDELVRRHLQGDWLGSKCFDFHKVTPLEIIARRIRAEKTLFEIHNGELDHYLSYDLRPEVVEKRIATLNTEVLAEAGLLASAKRPGLEKLYVMEIWRRLEHQNA
jgi:hypothetical protein